MGREPPGQRPGTKWEQRFGAGATLNDGSSMECWHKWQKPKSAGTCGPGGEFRLCPKIARYAKAGWPRDLGPCWVPYLGLFASRWRCMSSDSLLPGAEYMGPEVTEVRAGTWSISILRWRDPSIIPRPELRPQGHWDWAGPPFPASA